MRLRRSSSDEGFTLIELLVVMIIIGILAAIAIPMYLNQRRNAYDTAAKSDLRSIASQEEGYYASVQDYGTFAQMMAAGVSFNHLSPHVTVSIMHLETYGFCLRARNAHSSEDWFYDSQAGGLQDRGTATCPVTTGGIVGDSLSG